MEMDIEASNEDDICENIGLGCALEMFSEWKEVLNMINTLKSASSCQDVNKTEQAYEKFKYILNQYKEQPHLLDPYLDQMLGEILDLVKETNTSMELRHRLFKYLFVIVNVRGYKVVVRHLPHEVSDLEVVLSMLESQNEKDTLTWETRYCLLLWLSIIVMIPFHMARLDSGNQEKTVMDRLLDVCKKYLMGGDSCRMASAYLSSKLLTRSDVKEAHLKPFLDWACSSLVNEQGSWKRFGPLSSLAAILKHGKREDLLPYATLLFTRIIDAKCRNDSYRLTRKYAMKIIHRIGLTLLKPRLASWRYKRGCRQIVLNLNAGDAPTKKEQTADETTSDDEEDFDVPDEIEEIVDELIQGLSDPDITIRWSAAKGIGRITARLSKTFGDDIVESVLELLTPRMSDAAWHGGCLALAELGKRGLLLPSRLPQVVPRVVNALNYDEPRGYLTVGAHIRDAACYVCWAFARAYDTDVLKPYVNEIAKAMLIVACFDREIHCRRAASAAFQENVGRQGSFPHGIDILTEADYFAVGPRSNAYLNVSYFISQYEEYTVALIDHLVQKKLDHWDIAIRELSSKALHKLTDKAPEYMSKTVVYQLVEKTNQIDLNARHGAVIALGEVIHALSILNIAVDGVILEAVKNLIKVYNDRNFFMGLSGELMKLAFCHLIQKCSMAKIEFNEPLVIEQWRMLLDECLCHEVANVRAKAVEALPALCTQYYRRPTDGAVCREQQMQMVDKYTKQLANSVQVVRMGYALALGSLPAFMLKGCLKSVILGLVECTKITELSAKWAESRRDAIRSLTEICSTVGVGPGDENESCRPLVRNLMECFLEGLEEYTLDSRGDVGSWVREASMTGLSTLVNLCVKEDGALLDADLIEKTVIGISQQAVERIDKMRAHAAKIFCSLLYSDPKVPHIPAETELMAIFAESVCKSSDIDWSSMAETFPRFVPLINLPAFSYNVMLGFIASVGGLTESLVKHSSAALFNHLKTQTKPELERLGEVILAIFEKNQHSKRLGLPILVFLDRLFSSMAYACVVADAQSSFAAGVFQLTKVEISRKQTTAKLSASIDVFCQLIQVRGDVGKKALRQLGLFLSHQKFKWLRQATASKLYEALTMLEGDNDIDDDDLEKVMTLLSDTEWSTKTDDELREARTAFYALVGVNSTTATKT
ncbi:tubulin-specific chaperone D [Nilaparvata lugens]|uniref:tubulin-specific chaperone D n=1 Tax=Nilaparvata lugens TaxID=108931 RepID=UPI00193CB33C|nr:tubulin-specific chaperone D [Nilaparvata lugens]